MTWVDKKIKAMDIVQDEAVNAWANNNYKGTVAATTGSGKSFIGCKAIIKAYEDGVIKKGDKIGFFAETQVRENTFREEEFPKFKQVTGHDLEKFFDVQFRCYQGNPTKKEQFDMIICDEISEMLTAKYHDPLFFDGPKIGLDATVPEALSVYRNELPHTMLNKINQGKKKRDEGIITELINKGELLDMYMPVVYELSYEDAVRLGIVAPSNVFVIDHSLDNNKKNMKPFKTKDFYTTEFDYWNRKFNLSRDFTKSPFVRLSQARELSAFISTMPSKFEAIKGIVTSSANKTIVFNQKLEPLRLINLNVAEKDNTQYLIDQFNDDEITNIASAIKLKRGITLKKCTNVVIATPYQNFHHFEQMRGRAVRLDYEDKIANIIVFRTNGTYEEKWFDNMQNVYSLDGDLKRTVYMGDEIKFVSSKRFL